ncbi:MAG: hypothetical protein PSV17_02060 [Methylotenera sp.]|uniref:hypothetical protein n=1 Tax=Methylotenera sp. TaxID=2051956 RepID=UPI0024885A5C|nr:hypothetical protein [Methylotenera sp.]MDI1308205.1 hypothetical protein [Methylotenera sp.]
MQKGAALILMAFILGLGVAVFVLKTYNADATRARQDEKTYQTLSQAKKALIAWSVSNSKRPGQMPFPDRNGDGNYDGYSDCNSPASTFSYSFLIGQMPVFGQTNPCVSPQVGIGEDFIDAQGKRLWYAVSRNLMHKYESLPVTPTNDPVINPNIINSPSYAWLKVLDSEGKVISDRVAAVIIAPGNAIGEQARSAAAPSPNQYLDSFILGGTTYSNSSYLVPDQAFVMGLDERMVGVNDTRFVKPYYFNDKLAYITIDELMAGLSSRAAAEAKTKLLNYKKSTAITSPPGYYPYASLLGLIEHYQKNNQYDGFLPILTATQPTTSCSVTYTNANASSATCAASSFVSIEFTRTSGTFTTITGSGCQITNSDGTCSCAITSSSGGCSDTTGTNQFTCTLSGCSTTGSLPGSYVFNGAFKYPMGTPAIVQANTFNGICRCGANSVICSSSSAAVGDFSNQYATLPDDFNSVATNSTLPSWFTVNKWQDYLYYQVSSNCTYGQSCDSPDVSVGNKLASPAMIAATGAPIISAPFAVKGAAQTHSGCDVKEYLDSLENTNLDTKFEANTKPRLSNYNDQTFVVMP